MKKVLAILLALTMALSLCSTAWATDVVESENVDAAVTTYESVNGIEGAGEANVPAVQTVAATDVAKIGDTGYATLEAAVNAVKSGETITLLANCHGNGITVPSGSNFTIDFNTFTYDVNGDLAGSTGTKSQAFQLLKDSTLTFKNGTITSTTAKMLIQNYSNLTLDNMKIDGSKILESYTLSNNNGNVTIKDTTITAPTGGFAFDVYGGWGTYGDVKVTVEGNSVINGKVELARVSQNDNGAKNELVVKNGTFNYEIKVDSHEKTNVSVSGGTFVNDVTGYVTDKNIPVATVGGGTIAAYAVGENAVNAAAAKATSGDTVTVKQGNVSMTGVASGVTVSVASGASATVNNTAVPAGKSYTVGTANVAMMGGKEYASLQDAINSAAKADSPVEVKLLTDVTESVTIPYNYNINLNLNSKKLTNTAGSHTITVETGATLTVTGPGTVDNVTNGMATIYNKGTATLNGGTFERSAETGVDKNTSGGNSFYTILNHGTMTVKEGTTVKNKGHFSSLFENGYYNWQQKDGIANPSLTINGGTFDGGLNTIKNDDDATLLITGGTFNNYTQAAFQNHHIAKVTGGNFMADAYYSVDNCGCDATHDIGQLEITGGTFKGELYVHGDSSNVTVSGGTFTGNVKKTAGNLSITGGTWSVDVKDQVPANTPIAKITINNKTTFVVGQDNIQAAAKNAKSGDVIEITQGNVTLTGIAGGVTVKTPGSAAATVNGTAVTEKAYPNGYTVPTYSGSTGGGFPSSGTKKDDTKKDNIKSATTFDAGIALYVGMSILSLTGTAAVIGKKKEF